MGGGQKYFGVPHGGGSKIFGPCKLHSLFTHTGKFILDSIAKTTFWSPFCDTLKQGSQLRCNWLTALAIAIFSFLQDLLMEGQRKSARFFQSGALQLDLVQAQNSLFGRAAVFIAPYGAAVSTTAVQCCV